MKLISTLGLALLVTTGCTTTSHDMDSQKEIQDTAEAGMMDEAEMMAKMMELGKPGEHHAEFAKGAGKWSVATKMWMGPDAEPEMMEASADSKMILGGRYMVEEFKGSAMGMPFEGMAIVGYSNIDKEFWSIWLDTWSTWPSLSTGQKDAAGVLIMNGTMKDAMTPKGRPFRMETKHMSDDEFIVTMFDTGPDGTEWKVMEMVYTR